ncbi:MAG: hypothetical protein HQL06_04285 [Nitrospirae bacterium]|nr:hypothetical protein [Nitrospirota bacterium]
MKRLVGCIVYALVVVTILLAAHRLRAEPGTPAPEQKQQTPQNTQQVPKTASEQADAEHHATIPKYFTTRPPFSEGIFPCTTCHAGLKPDKTRRELYFHTEISLKHAAKQRWCLDCHDSENRDRLRLANGDHVTFEESYMLCGQCHGNVFREWKKGIHGKRTGLWNSDKPGDKVYLLCVNCHNPHSPQFKPIKPLPLPVRPNEITNIKGTSTVEIEGHKLYIPVYGK